MTQLPISPRPPTRRRKNNQFFLEERQWLVVLVAISMTAVAWALDLRETERNPPLEWAIASLRGGGPLVAVGILIGGRFRAVGPSLAAGLAIWVCFLGALAIVLEIFALLRFR